MNWKEKIEYILSTGMSKSELARQVGYVPSWVDHVLNREGIDLAWTAGQKVLQIERKLKRKSNVKTNV